MAVSIASGACLCKLRQWQDCTGVGFATCLPGVCSQDWKCTGKNKDWQSHPDTADLQHHQQGRTKALGIPEKGVSANSHSPTINPVGLWSFKVQQFQICFTNAFPKARTVGSLLECGTTKINTALDT